MGLVKLGPLAAAVSGTVGGSVFAHNRGGAYIRIWAKPHIVSSTPADTIKAMLGTTSRLWATLTDAQRAAWRSYAVENPVVNRLGDSRTLSGHQAFNAINTRMGLMGVSYLEVPPLASPPNPISAVTFTCDISDTAAPLAINPTPVPANTQLWVWACVVGSPGVAYIGNRLRLLKRVAAATASPVDIYDDLVARFGELTAGQVVHLSLQAADEQTGLVSGFSIIQATVTQ